MISLNVQPQESLQRNDNGFLEVHSVFKTIQGEGPFVGTPCVFVRLTGCNLQCPLCDTEYTSKREAWTPDRLVERIGRLKKGGLVVITGGEPFRQTLGPFVRALLKSGRYVQIETNGTLFDDTFPFGSTTIVCSPKTPKVHPELVHWIDCLKYVVEDGQVDPDDGLPTSVLGGSRPWRPSPTHIETLRRTGSLYVQPCDHQDPVKNAANMKAAVDSCLKFGYRLCLQMHKYAGLE